MLGVAQTYRFVELSASALRRLTDDVGAPLTLLFLVGH